MVRACRSWVRVRSGAKPTPTSHQRPHGIGSSRLAGRCDFRMVRRHRRPGISPLDGKSAHERLALALHPGVADRLLHLRRHGWAAKPLSLRPRSGADSAPQVVGVTDEGDSGGDKGRALIDVEHLIQSQVSAYRIAKLGQ